MPAVKRFSVSFAKYPTNGTSASFKYFSTSPPSVCMSQSFLWTLGFCFNVFHMALQHLRFYFWFLSLISGCNFGYLPICFGLLLSNTTWHSLSNQGSHRSLARSLARSLVRLFVDSLVECVNVKRCGTGMSADSYKGVRVNVQQTQSSSSPLTLIQTGLTPSKHVSSNLSVNLWICCFCWAHTKASDVILKK